MITWTQGHNRDFVVFMVDTVKLFTLKKMKNEEFILENDVNPDLKKLVPPKYRKKDPVYEIVCAFVDGKIKKAVS